MDKEALIEYGLNRIKLSSSAVDLPDPTKITLSYYLAFFSPPPYCKLATTTDDFDFSVLVDLQGDIGWVDATKHQEDAYMDRFREIEDRREGWAFSDGSIMNATFWLPNEPNPYDEGKIANAAVFDPGPPPGLASASAKSDQPGAYYICCYELRKDELMGGTLDNVRGTLAEQLELEPTTSSPTSEPTTATPTKEPTDKPTDKPTSAPTDKPTDEPTDKPTDEPTSSPTSTPTDKPTDTPTVQPTVSNQPTTDSTSSPTKGCDFDPFQTSDELREQVQNYLSGNATEKARVEAKYGLIENWCVFKLSDFSEVFLNQVTFNEDISGWDVSNAETMKSMFQGAAAFDMPLEAWDVRNVKNMLRMFKGAVVFDQPLEGWQVDNVEDMTFMFEEAAQFDQPLNGWNVERVTSMAGMFSQASNFDQPLADWNVANVVNMALMFNAAESFSYPLGDWDVSGVTEMQLMFRTATLFDHPLDEWDVSAVNDISQMFQNAAIFNQNLCAWGSKLARRGVQVEDAFLGSNCENENDPDLEADVPGPLCVDCTAENSTS